MSFAVAIKKVRRNLSDYGFGKRSGKPSLRCSGAFI